MRTLLTIVFVFHCTRCLFADQQPPLTVKEIGLMLRSGLSSETILRDLSTRHFADTLDPAAEKQLRQANASPALVDALKSGNNTASQEEVVQASASAASAHDEVLQREAQRQRELQKRSDEEYQRFLRGERIALDPERQKNADQALAQAKTEARQAQAEAQQNRGRLQQLANMEQRKGDYGSLAARGFGSDTSAIQERVEKEKRDSAAAAAAQSAHDTFGTSDTGRTAIVDGSLLPSEKAAMKTYPNLTPEELRSLLPSERAAANAKKGAAIAAAKATAEQAWCAAHPDECVQKAADAAAAQADSDRQREQARAEEEDRQQARRVVGQMETNLFMGHSADQLKTDLFMAKGQGGPETRRVINQMETNLFMGHSADQLKTDLFMLKH